MTLDIKTKRAKEEAEKERLQEKTRENKENEEEQKRLDAQTPGVCVFPQIRGQSDLS